MKVLSLLMQNNSWSLSHEAMSYWMSEVEARMVQRRHHLKQVCAKLDLDVYGNDSLHRPNPWEFLVNRPHHLVWCNVFKAASTSWMYNFNILAGYNPKFLRNSKLVPLNLARRRYPRPSLHALQQALNDSVAFLIVRHPLERLLSAYRDKIQFSLPHTLHQKLGNEIILKYRKNKQKVKGSRNKSTPKKPRWPTFSEFVQYLVNVQQKGDPFDMHWAPITHFCTPCQVDFDIIMKFETLQEDQNYLIHQAGLQDIIRPEWKNPAKGCTTTELVTSYYSQLTRAQILQLYHIYRYDFELFGYTLDGYLQLGMTESNSAGSPAT
ncbi:Carbohydrate sulfotransferase 11 [Zootermopsis nevadensis]|uniref:Carbohydrate sulfotransferase n=1 Tax=Zootermopsis nevadensis TaxID=136037 RepID=A0A067QKN1_ZOONE|nr:Carbohydrate sulfotransferase 11 [Zootermopsis nevadensis]